MTELLHKEDEMEVRLENVHFIVDHHLLFFYSNQFIKRNPVSNPLFFNLYIGGKNLISIVFEVVDQVAISLPQSPFGGIIIGEMLNEKLITSLLIIIKQFFHKKQIKVKIITPPNCYKSNYKQLKNILIGLGFEPDCHNINQHIAIDQRVLSKKMNASRSKQLNVCINRGYQFKELDTASIPQAYTLIEACLKVKNYPITLSLNALKTCFDKFPKNYLIFGVFHKNTLIATAISVIVNHKILYNFYHGDKLNKRQDSPMSLLLAGIYGYCQQNNFKTLDLGISTDQGVYNKGLFYFKRSCGAISSDKISYQLNT